MSDPFWDSFNNGFAAVSKVRQNHALATYRKDQGQGLNELMGVNPELAGQMQDQQHQNALFDQGQQDRQGMMQAGQMMANGNQQGAMQNRYAAGDFQGAQQIQQMIASTDAAGKAKLAEEVQKHLPAFYALSKVPANQRTAWLQQNGQQYGMDVSNINPQDLTDESIQGHLAQGVGVLKMIELDAQQAKAQQQAQYQNASIDVRRQQVANSDKNAAWKHRAPKAGSSIGHELPSGFQVIP